MNSTDLDIGNWVLYIPENCFCTIESIGRSIYVKHYDGRVSWCSIDDITSVRITPDNLSVCGFTREGNYFTKQTATKQKVIVSFNPDNTFTLSFPKKDGFIVHQVHTLQNRYLELTGEKLLVNLYGIK